MTVADHAMAFVVILVTAVAAWGICYVGCILLGVPLPGEWILLKFLAVATLTYVVIVLLMRCGNPHGGMTTC